MSPNRNNIMYHIQASSEDVTVTFQWLIEELQLKGRNTPKTVIFCRIIEVCARLYCAFDMTLKLEGYIGGVISAASCLFAMYHAKVTDSQKAVIMESFSKVDGSCRVLFATVAFGMGINIPDIRRVIHFGPSTDIEEYVQQSGRGGRDGDQCHALLYTYSGCTRGHVSNDMKEYWKSTDTCHRWTLFQYFPGLFVQPSVLHKCCDACQSKCLCSCQCHHCECGVDSPCLVCCVCITKCSYVPPFPTLHHESKEENEDIDTHDICWNEQDSIFTESH